MSVKLFAFYCHAKNAVEIYTLHLLTSTLRLLSSHADMYAGDIVYCFSQGAEGGPVCNYMSPNFDS